MPIEVIQKRVKKMKQMVKDKYGVDNPAQIPESREKNCQAQLGKKISDATKKKLSQQRKGIPKNFDKSELDRRSKAITGERNPMYGKTGKLHPNFGGKYCKPYTDGRRKKRAEDCRINNPQVKGTPAWCKKVVRRENISASQVTNIPIL